MNSKAELRGQLCKLLDKHQKAECDFMVCEGCDVCEKIKLVGAALFKPEKRFAAYNHATKEWKYTDSKLELSKIIKTASSNVFGDIHNKRIKDWTIYYSKEYLNELKDKEQMFETLDKIFGKNPFITTGELAKAAGIDSSEAYEYLYHKKLKMRE